MKRLALVGLALAAVVAGGLLVLDRVMPSWYAERIPGWYARRVYPLTSAGDIRAAAVKYRLDPALVAAIIYEESRFRPDTVSRSGAVGLMQVLPSTAEEIADKTGGERFVLGDLSDPRINILYGSNYVRYLLDHFNGSQVMAVAAYNAGLRAVDGWAARAQHYGDAFTLDDVAFAETRDYVREVQRLQKVYRRAYDKELGAAP
jgi:soluble lytic murein transglycosylase